MVFLFCKIAKNILAPLGVTALVSAIDARIEKIVHGFGVTLVISNKEINDIMKIVKALEDFGIILKGLPKRWIFSNILGCETC